MVAVEFGTTTNALTTAEPDDLADAVDCAVVEDAGERVEFVVVEERAV